jgi:hypothetical protein
VNEALELKSGIERHIRSLKPIRGDIFVDDAKVRCRASNYLSIRVGSDGQSDPRSEMHDQGRGCSTCWKVVLQWNMQSCVLYELSKEQKSSRHPFVYDCLVR